METFLTIAIIAVSVIATVVIAFTLLMASVACSIAGQFQRDTDYLN